MIQRMPIDIQVPTTVRLFTVRDMVQELRERGFKMPGGSDVTYALFLNYMKTLQRRGLGANKVGRSWVISENQLRTLVALWKQLSG